MKPNTTITERINKILESCFSGNKSEFARMINVGESNIRSYLNGTLPKADTLENITTNIGISCDWLLTGEGEMLKKTQTENELTSTNSNESGMNQELFKKYVEATETIADLREEIGTLKAEVDYLRGQLGLSKERVRS